MKSVLYILEAVEGGAWRHLKDLISAIHGRSINCHVALSFERPLDNFDGARAFLASMNVPLYEIPMKRGVAPGDPRALLKLIKLIRRIQPDLVHSHCAKAGVVGRLAAKLVGVPSVYTPHCFPFFMTNTPLSHVYRFIEKGMLKITTAIIVISRQEHAAALQLGYSQKRVFFVPNGIESRALSLPPIKNNDPTRLIFLGRSGAQKGMDCFVRLVAELNLRGLKSEGYLYGAFIPEDIASDFQNRSLENVRFCGSCAPEQVVGLLRECDVVVMPSRWEGLPYLLLESLDAGVPVSAYGVGGISDVVRHGESAMLAAPANFERLVDNTAQLRDAALRRKIAEGGREAVKPYTLNRMVQSTLAVYESVCSKE